MKVIAFGISLLSNSLGASEAESEASVSAESANSSEVDELQTKRTKVEPAPVSVMETPQPIAKVSN